MTLEVFGEDGGHGAENETAYVMAIDPALVHKEDYKPEMATALPLPNTWSAYPFPSTIMLYKEGQGYPTFDPEKAKTLFHKSERQDRGLDSGNDPEMGHGWGVSGSGYWMLDT